MPPPWLSSIKRTVVPSAGGFPVLICGFGGTRGGGAPPMVDEEETVVPFEEGRAVATALRGRGGGGGGGEGEERSLRTAEQPEKGPGEEKEGRVDRSVGEKD